MIFHDAKHTVCAGSVDTQIVKIKKKPLLVTKGHNSCATFSVELGTCFEVDISNDTCTADFPSSFCNLVGLLSPGLKKLLRRFHISVHGKAIQLVPTLFQYT